MIRKNNQSLIDFDFWSGAKDTVSYLSDAEIDKIDKMLSCIYDDGMTDVEINDFFWFEDDTIAEWLGYTCFDDIMSEDERDPLYREAV